MSDCRFSFFEDSAPIKEAQEKHKDFAHLMPSWSDHSTGMAQVILWSALELEGFGVSLLHVRNSLEIVLFG